RWVTRRPWSLASTRRAAAPTVSNVWCFRCQESGSYGSAHRRARSTTTQRSRSTCLERSATQKRQHVAARFRVMGEQRVNACDDHVIACCVASCLVDEDRRIRRPTRRPGPKKERGRKER